MMLLLRQLHPWGVNSSLTEAVPRYLHKLYCYFAAVTVIPTNAIPSTETGLILLLLTT